MSRFILKKILGEKNIRKIKVYIYPKLLRLRMRLYGEKALKIIDEESRKLGVRCWLMFGTLLGAVREHDFIKHDDDIDVGMFCKDMDKNLIDSFIRKGFTFSEAKVSSDKRFRKLGFKFHFIPIDIYGHNFDNDNTSDVTGFETLPLEGKTWKYSYEKNLFRVCLLHYKFTGLKDCKFRELTLQIPNNSDEILEQHYGKDYMIPRIGAKGATSSLIEIPPIEKLSASILEIESL